jgi:Ca-activated chloride channel family protein
MPVRARDPFTGAVVKDTVMADVKVNPELLQSIAERTGGEFFRAGDPEALRQVFDRIDRLEKSEIKTAAFRRYRELFPPVLTLSALLLAAAGLAWAAGLRVVPA